MHFRDNLEKEMATHSISLLGKSHGQSSLVGFSPWGRKEWVTTEQLILTLLASTEDLLGL